MEAVLEELKDREEELKEAIAELQKTKSTLRNAFQQAVGGAPGPAAGSQVPPPSPPPQHPHPTPPPPTNFTHPVTHLTTTQPQTSLVFFARSHQRE